MFFICSLSKSFFGHWFKIKPITLLLAHIFYELKICSKYEFCQILFESKRKKSLLKGIHRFKEVFTKYKAKTRKRASNHWANRAGVWSNRSQGSKISGLSAISDNFTKSVRLRAIWITVLRSSYVHARCT